MLNMQTQNLGEISIHHPRKILLHKQKLLNTLNSVVSVLTIFLTAPCPSTRPRLPLEIALLKGLEDKVLVELALAYIQAVHDPGTLQMRFQPTPTRGSLCSTFSH